MHDRCFNFGLEMCRTIHVRGHYIIELQKCVISAQESMFSFFILTRISKSVSLVVQCLFCVLYGTFTQAFFLGNHSTGHPLGFSGVAK